MNRILALAAPLMAVVLVGCQTVETPPATTIATPVEAAMVVIPPLQPVIYSNVTPVAGITYVGLDDFTTSFIDELLKYYLARPDTAQFDHPFIAGQEGDSLLVCGTLSASDGTTRHSLVPFALTLYLDKIAANDLDNGAVLNGLGASVLIRSTTVTSYSDAEIRAVCRDYLGANLQAPRPR